MEMRYLGSTGVKVSALCFGTMTFGKNQWGVGHVREREAVEMVAACLDAGVNFFDTADVYSLGESETLLGKAIRGRREEVVIATKVRGRMGPGPNKIGLSRHHILNSVDGSLKRLGTDNIDLYQVHGWDHATPLTETLRALDDLVRWGKVRYVGASNFAAWQLAKALWLSDRHGWARFETLQPYYSLVGREIEHELVPLCLDQGLGILPWSPLAGGFLSGKYRKDRPAPEGARLFGPLANFIPVDRDKAGDTLSVLEDVSRAHKAAMATVALAWLGGRPGVTSVIIGARTMAQLRDNLKAAEITLSGEETARLDEVSAIPMPYPQWMIGYMRQDR
jgi:aryl-alcohol dehydrogenase-like predicted oxidoreductase